jgi:hypothetical protein
MNLSAKLGKLATIGGPVAKSNAPKLGPICMCCRQRIKWFTPRRPHIVAREWVGWRHAGCRAK